MRVRYVKSLFTNIQKQYLKIILFFKNICKLSGQIIQEFLELRMRNFRVIVFLWI